jgi:pyruvate,water dikinase
MHYIVSKVKEKIPSEKSIGGKAKNLIWLVEKYFKVPDFFVISSDINNIQSFQRDIEEAYDNLGGGLVAVRSSATGEDSTKQSFAGQYKSILSVSKDGLITAINDCRDSLNSHHALAYSKNMTGDKMAIIIQKMIFADLSGVAFSADPVRNDRTVVVVESVKGSCDQLVSGIVTPDHHEIRKDKINEESVPENIKKVALITTAIENKFGHPVDIEWAFQNNTLYILQVRPITTINN